MNQERLMKVLLGPHVSEKCSTMAEKHRQIAFKVVRNATKAEIKRAVELLFEVKVDRVHTVNMKGGQRNFRQVMGRKKAWKKAYVSLKEGYDINFSGETA